MLGEFAVIGLSHETAPVATREAVSRKPEGVDSFGPYLRERFGLDEVVVLSTCSRFEVYAVASEGAWESLTAWFTGRTGCDRTSALYAKRGRGAVVHLFRVAAGLDSWVLGETEILGQVKTAYQDACAEETASRISNITFQRALKTGKEVRSGTGIVGGIASIGGAAAVLARQIFSDLSEKQMLVFGAGAMAESTVRHLCAKGVAGVCVSNRSLDNARALAASLQGRACSLPEGLERLAEADIAVFSTGADHFLLDAKAAREFSRRRGGRPLFIIDIALPRNVDPEAGRAPDVYLYDLDDLRRVMDKSLDKRRDEVAKAEGMVGEESADTWGRIVRPACPRPVEPCAAAA